MNEQDFDRLLYDAALPPEDSESPQPWGAPMARICWGLALVTVTLNFWGLNYMLPALGAVLLWLGFRTLRRENPAFRFAYWVSTAAALLRLTVYILLATPLAPYLSDTIGHTLVLSFLLWLLYLSLWLGLRQVFHKAGQPPQTRSAGALLLWYTVLFPLALMGVQGLLAWVILILWVIILVGLSRVSRSLDNSGYTVTPAPIRLSDRRAAGLWLGVTAVAVVLCMIFSQRLPMKDVTPVENAPTAHAELRQELLDLGFPEEVLADLSDEDIAPLEGALTVYVNTNSARGSNRELEQLSTHFIQVQLPEGELHFVYWFTWTQLPSHRLMEGLEIIPSYQNALHLSPGQTVRGRLLWEEGGLALQTPLLDDSLSSYTYDSLFFGPSSQSSFCVDFSLPKDGENLRGYVTWQAMMTRPGLSLNYNSEVRVVHQESRLNYPWRTPCRYQQITNNNNDRRFPSFQDLVLFQVKIDAES